MRSQFDMRIEFGNIKLGGIAKKHLMDCIKTSRISSGPKVAAFESGWNDLFGYNHSIMTSSGTSADIAALLSLYSLGASRGDEVILPACCFVAVGNAVLAAGFTPVFVDVERDTININPNLIEDKITSRTCSILAVDSMGKPCEYDTILDIAKRHRLYVISDSCEAYGSTYKNNFIGNISDLVTASFYVAHLITAGEGGCVSTRHKELHLLLKSVIDHGRRDGVIYFDFDKYGLNLKPNDLTAAVGLESLGNFWGIFNQRRSNLDYLIGCCKDLDEYLMLNMEESHERCAPHAFNMILKDPSLNYNKFYEYLETNSILCKRTFGSLPTQHAAFSWMHHSLGDFPQAEYLGDNSLHVGVHQYLSQEDLDYMVEVIHKYFKNEI